MIELRKKYKSGSAVEILCEAILIGDIPGGIALTQNEIAFSLGTSRMPVREALIVLEYQGLVERFTNQHIRVINIHDEYIREVFADMSLLEVEILKNISDEKISALSSYSGQQEYHRALCANVKSHFTRKMLGVLTEIYLAFVLEHSSGTDRIDAVFGNLLQAVKIPLDLDVIRSCYAVYSEVLASEFMRIRRKE